MRWETKRNVWAINWIRWHGWLPESTGGFREDDIWMAHWGCFSIERFSKDWLKLCDKYGCGFESTFEWLEEELAKPTPANAATE